MIRIATTKLAAWVPVSTEWLLDDILLALDCGCTVPLGSQDVAAT